MRFRLQLSAAVDRSRRLRRRENLRSKKIVKVRAYASEYVPVLRQDAQLSQRDRAAGCVIVCGRLELG